MTGKLLVCIGLGAVLGYAAERPSVSADLGPCSAGFSVTDGSKAIYNAKVTTHIKYGAFGVRKLDLEVGTDSDGRAAVLSLPARSKQPIAFEITKGDISRTVLYDPATQCNAHFDVQLRAARESRPGNPQP